jgi:hypothetical protein
VNFPTDVQERVADLLFGPDGLQLSGYRYNIGGGGEGVTNPVRAPKQFPDDTAGRTFLQFAADAQVPLLTGFVNSAPPEYTTNGKTCGGSLKPGMEDEFADYLTNIVTELRDENEITLDFVSPMNEPADSFSDCGQEGMAVPIDQRAPLVQALGKALADAAPDSKVIADETTADAILSAEAPQWLSVPGTTEYLAAIAHHTYDFPDDALRKLVPPVAKLVGKPTWMTEICCYKGSGGVASSMGANYDPSMTQGLWLANQIYDDFTIAGDSAWYWWTALSPVLGCDPKADPACPTQENTEGFNDGLIYYDENYADGGTTDLYISKRYGVLGQFSRTVRPGAVRHDVDDAPKAVRMLAFNDGNTWNVVAWNEGTTESTIGIALPDTAPMTNATASVTDINHDFAPAIAPARTDSGAWLATIAPDTVVTYTFT